MLATRLIATHDIRSVELPVPEPGPGEVLIRVESAGICGTDRHLYKGEFPCTPPVTLGHEFSGIVLAGVVGWLLVRALAATGALTVLIGLIIASAAPAIVVYAQELVPGRTGLIAGLFFGFAFGMGGIAAAVLGWVADARGIRFVFLLCSFLPLLGLLTALLPRQRELVPAR